MSKSRQKAVQRYHDRVAHQYDHIYDDIYWQWHDKLTWHYLKPRLPAQQNEPIIDLGCGTGKWGVQVARSGYRVTCLDISAKMVDVVRRRVAELGLERKVHCIRADLVDLSELPRNHFALAMAFGEALGSADLPARALKEIHKILKPGGLLVATIDNRLNAIEFYLEKNDVQGLAAFLKTGRTRWLTRDQAEQFELRTYTPRQLTRLLAGAEYEVLEIVGKTVLPLRKYRSLLEDKESFRRLLTMEKKLARDLDAIGRAAHLQFVARRM